MATVKVNHVTGKRYLDLGKAQRRASFGKGPQAPGLAKSEWVELPNEAYGPMSQADLDRIALIARAR